MSIRLRMALLQYHIILLFLCLALQEEWIAAQRDSLQQGEFFNSSTTLVSYSSEFTLGFFHPTDSEYSYLGIWYTDNYPPPSQHPVWVANRNEPVSNNTGMLILDPESGKLIIKQQNEIVSILYSGGGGSVVSHSTRILTLLDSGNLVLKEGNLVRKEGDITLWQSFDYPTDKILPGMKLGINHKTNQTWSLTSWSTKIVPASGAFTLEWDPAKRMMAVKYRGKIHWTSGKLINNKFQNIPTYVQYNIVSDKDKDYILFTSMYYGWQMDYMGNINYYGEQIATADECYGYDIRGRTALDLGCELWDHPKCRNDRQKFEIRTGYFENASAAYYHNASLGYGDCKAMCWEDCYCFGFVIDDDFPSPAECSLYSGSNAKFHLDGNWGNIYVLTSDSTGRSDTDPTGRFDTVKIWKKGIIIIVIVALVFVLVLLLWGLLRYRRKKFEQARESKIDELRMMNGYTDTIDELGNDGLNDLKFFSFNNIVAATRNFSSDNKLGEGGFGPVYKGEFPEGQEIAVKRLSKKSTQGMIELRNELILIAKLQHTNLVRLLGCCIFREEKMLIYEYMPNKSLDFFLFDESKREQLIWERRFSITGGIAQGLLYLHTYSRLRIIHRDLKAANILLDQNMNPKISDFGLARIFKQNLLEANTNRVVGTYGYMAPEYAMEGIFSVKSDVYSFGVLILEIVSGRKNNSFYHVDGPLNLVALAWELWNRDATCELMDPSIRNSCDHHQFLRCAHIGLLCVEDRAVDRPTMADVISMFLNDTADLPLPKRPAFYTGSRLSENEPGETNPEKMSLNDLSISAIEAR